MSPVPTLAQVTELWLAAVEVRADLSPSSIVTYRRVGQLLQAWGRDRPLGHVDLSPYVMVRRELRMAPRTIALELRVASAIFRWARRSRVVRDDAVLQVPRLKIDPNRFDLNHRTPTPGEAARAISAMPRDDWRLATLLIARTGARVGEVVWLRGCDLDELGRRVAFGASSKSSKTGMRWFPLDSASLRMLRGRSDRNKGSLFGFDQVTAPIQALNRRLAAACAAAGVSRFTPHGLRRMVVNRLMRARIDAATAAVLTGHTVQVMLRHYRQVTDEDRRAAVALARLGVLVD